MPQKFLLTITVILSICLSSKGDVITLHNEAIQAGISTKTGHTVFIAALGQTNLLYEREDDLGGEAFHPLQQVQLWFLTGPGSLQPDTTFWDSPWKILEQSEDKLVLESGISPLLSIKVTRNYHLIAGKPALEVKTLIERVAPNPYPVHVWSVTQLARPRYVLLDVVEMTGPHGLPWKELSRPGRLQTYMRQPLEGAVRFAPKSPMDNPKIGTLGNWVAAVIRPDLALVKSVPIQPGGCYPDGTSMQAYASEDFTEIETLSTNQHLQPGEIVSSRSVWQLVRAPEGTTPEDWIQHIDTAVDNLASAVALP